MQGMGWLTQEELRWDANGRLATLAPTTYKPPTAHDVPADLRTRLFEDPLEPDTIHGSKAVGEPPLLLSFSVFLAIRDAISSVADDRVDPAAAGARHRRGDPPHGRGRAGAGLTVRRPRRAARGGPGWQGPRPRSRAS